MQTPDRKLSATLSFIPPPLQVVLAILSIQLGAAFAINLFSIFGPDGTVFFRLIISAFLLCLFIRPKINENTIKHYKLLIIYGVALGLMNWCFYESIARIPLGIAVAIEFMGPLLVAVYSSRRAVDFLWIVVAFIGVLMLAPKIGTDLDPVGVGYAVLAGIGWGSFVIFSKRVNQALPGSDGLAIGMVIAAFFMFPFAVGSIAPVFINPFLIGNLIALAVLSTTVPFYLEFSALKTLTPQAYGVLITLEPAVAAIIGVIALGDVLGVEGIIAVVCVTLAAIGATLSQSKNQA
jgi:inner membrane transporter RhtA